MSSAAGHFGWLFGAMAGGMAFGSPLGAIIVPFIGWQGLFLVVGAAGAAALFVLLPSRAIIAVQPVTGSLRDLFRGYKDLLRSPRAQRTYGYVLVNSMFHSGVFTWLGVYFERHYGIGPAGIGLTLLGYGVPGFLFGPVIGRAADRWGRARLLPIGLLLSALATAALMFGVPVILAPVVAMFQRMPCEAISHSASTIAATASGLRCIAMVTANAVTGRRRCDKSRHSRQKPTREPYSQSDSAVGARCGTEVVMCSVRKATEPGSPCSTELSPPSS
jgi:predicted MFS family arabinose efflux permease